ncbi:MAG: ABC transporter ATP-binding protein [Patescibacteria group bacterium]|nr:ABC transporter ATP-binding protein [Patescibacteria group bacterium]
MANKPIVKAEKLSVTYMMGRPNQVNALTDANLEIFPGEFVIFFGPSGCGKSTLLYAVAGLERNIQGDIFIDGKNLAKFNEKELDNHRQHTIGMIFQAYYLISSLSVFNNIVLPQFPLNVKNKEREKKAVDLLSFFGVKEQIKKYPNELSGGQQQRIAICRSLINDPNLILADEPTGNLDSKSATDVMNLLLELNEKKGKTVILVTHSPGSLDYAHRVFYMKDGKIIDVKVNRQPGEPVKKEVTEANVLAKDLETVSGGAGTGGSQINKSLELLARTYSNIAGQFGSLLIPFKAKQIVSEVLTSLGNHDIEALEKEVEDLLKKILSQEDFKSFLDRGVGDFGLGLDKRTAEKLSEKIYQIVAEIRDMEEQEKQLGAGIVQDNDKEVKDIREYLFEAFDVKIHDRLQLERVNSFIKQRLENKIDGKQFSANLDKSLKEGGVNLETRLARKLAQRLELLILGKLR